jgi:hypothetical protein
MGQAMPAGARKALRVRFTGFVFGSMEQAGTAVNVADGVGPGKLSPRKTVDVNRSSANLSRARARAKLASQRYYRDEHTVCFFREEGARHGWSYRVGVASGRDRRWE